MLTMPDSLTPPERETVILINDADDFAEISTHQRTWVTKLRKNPAAEELEDLSYGSTTGARFRLPARLVSVRTKERAVRALSEEEKARRAERLNATRAA
jgi:hypothetical protein